MFDSYGDGWNGATITLQIATKTLYSVPVAQDLVGGGVLVLIVIVCVGGGLLFLRAQKRNLKLQLKLKSEAAQRAENGLTLKSEATELTGKI